ncbi:DUF4198 domain-containing protein [Caulobacter sp. RHG1]|uniref:DUF4198 domain-containing protein n=1 Tax=Caulobacter sp. (strain RHG1) TaxID=2545762 RepID=UPI0015558A6C|nr:DUF4198 domain-containing protein [Caulobacter sp. RHG1]NQE63906.1 Nikel transport family protein NikM [Caulobacter sp. RHG1]
MTFKKSLLAVAALGAVLAMPLSAQAHRGWLLPSFTNLSGDSAWVTFDAAVSNELFHPDHVAMRTDGVQVLAPDGAIDKIQNASTGKYRSTFDVQLSKPGTYKIFTAGGSVMASYTENGEVKRFRGSAEDFAKQVPAGAADLKVIKSANRNETFVTRDKPTTESLKPTGKGLELVPVTHPTDVIATEPATFKFVIDGKPAADLEVTFAPGGHRWRASPGEIKVKTGPDGAVKFTLPEAGMYWVNASVRSGANARGGPPGAPQQGAVQALPGNGENASYTAVIEAQRP